MAEPPQRYRFCCARCSAELLTTDQVSYADVATIRAHYLAAHPDQPLHEPFGISAALRLVDVAVITPSRTEP